MTAPTRRRTRAREIAMQILFQIDLRGSDLRGLDLGRVDFVAEFGKTIEELCHEEGQGEADVVEFACRLVTGTIAEKKAIDERLQSVTRNWDLRRMANVDRNVLRMAMYELQHCDDVPPKVTINEAIDLAKKYSTANSGGFCNGILDRVRIDLEREETAAASPQAPEPASKPVEPDLDAGNMESGGAEA